MRLTLRQAHPTDLDTIMALETAGFPPGIVEESAVFEQRVHVFPEGFLLANTGDKAPCAYFCAEIWRDWNLHPSERFDLGHDLSQWLDRQGEILYLASMTVAPEAQGTGLGRALFQAGLREMSKAFPDLREAVLIVNEHWVKARSIYSSEGFAEQGRLPDFFQPTAGPTGDAIVMVRAI